MSEYQYFSDTAAVEQFAKKMADKMIEKHHEGRGGWHDPQECSVEDLARMLVEHVQKGDPIDIANFCMMIHHRGGAEPYPIRTALRERETKAIAKVIGVDVDRADVEIFMLEVKAIFDRNVANRNPITEVLAIATVDKSTELCSAAIEQPADKVRAAALELAAMAMQLALHGDAFVVGLRQDKGLDHIGTDANHL